MAASNPPARGLIDTHYHIVPPRYLERERKRIADVSAGLKGPFEWTPSRAIDEMNADGVETAVTSISAPGVWFDSGRDALELARICNEYAGQLASDHTGRFETFATLPLPNTEATLKEIDYAGRVLKTNGFCLMTSYDDKWLGDPSFVPVFEELDRRNAVVFVHPTAPACCTNFVPGSPTATMEFPFDTTRTISSLLLSGTTLRFPHISFIFSHCGGTFPMLMTRIARLNDRSTGRPGIVEREVQKMHYDVASVATQATVGALRQMVPVSQIVFGSDAPYWRPAKTVADLAALGLSKDELRAIERENAVPLLAKIRRDHRRGSAANLGSR